MNISRRTLAKGALWATPIITSSVAIPAMAASGGCHYTVPFKVTSANSKNPQMLEATSQLTGKKVKITVSSVSSSSTVHSQFIAETQRQENFNMSNSGNGVNGWATNDGVARDFIFRNFAPSGMPGAIVLNHRSTSERDPSPSQTLTFDFRDESGQKISVSNLRLEIFDISAAVSNRTWRQNYWDAVYFDQEPSHIYPSRGGGIGAGTEKSPFHRINGHSPTVPGYLFSDVFAFSQVPSSGLKMTYTQYGDRKGWQFISISGISFDSDC